MYIHTYVHTDIKLQEYTSEVYSWDKSKFSRWIQQKALLGKIHSKRNS